MYHLVVNTLIGVSPCYISFQMLINIFMKIPLEISNMEIFSAFPSDFNSCPTASTINFSLRASHYLYKLIGKKLDIFKQITIQCTEKMDFKAVPIQLTVDLCQPSVFPTHSVTPTLTGHWKDVNGWMDRKGRCLKNQQSPEGIFFIAVMNIAHLKLCTIYWNDWKSINLPIVLLFFTPLRQFWI